MPGHGSPNTSLIAQTVHVLLHWHASVTTARDVVAWHHGVSAQPASAHVDWSRRRGPGKGTGSSIHMIGCGVP
jgi:hypothetical protein